MKSIIQVKNTNMVYQSVRGERVDALHEIDLSVDEGEFVTILGPSGCGKTTLLNIIGGLIPPSSGSIHVEEKPVVKPLPDSISFVFQEPTLLPWRTVQKNVEFPLEVRGTSKEEREKIARKYIALVGIDKFSNHYPHELSGGMKQRVAIARALALETKIILMDEPFGALDEQSRIILGNELARIQARTGKTIVFVTHSIEEALYLSDRVAVMSRRPATINRIIEIRFPKPRDPSLRASYEFATLKAEIWKHLESQVEQGEIQA